MPTERPTILFTGPQSEDRRILFYKNAIEGSGGTLLTIPESAGKEEINILIRNAGGILLPGGADVNPALYGQLKQSWTEGINDARDTMETYVLSRAIDERVPTLAICRGLQILNVCLGGTLYQDVEKEMRGSIRHNWHKDDQGNELPRSRISHPIRILEGTLLHTIVGAREVDVNSLHHQGIDKLSKRLVASAFAPDGLIEAVEVADHPFLLGVQWHPEGLYSDPVWKHLFDVFVSKAGEHEGKR